MLTLLTQLIDLTNIIKSTRKIDTLTNIKKYYLIKQLIVLFE